MKPTTTKQLIKAFNTLRARCMASPNVPARQYLESLSDDDLFVFIAGKTYEFGRSIKDSLRNAAIHLETPESRAQAINSFSTKDPEAFR